MSTLVTSNNKTLKKLWLNNNLISDKGAKAIKRAFTETSNLVELYLGWNNISGTGGKAIAKLLIQDVKLKVLDLSWNNLGKNNKSKKSKPKSLGDIWGEALVINTTLIHLDLSFNMIEVRDSKVISEKLRSNHSLYGMHFKGNAGRIDSLGFLQVASSLNQNLRF